MQSPESESLDEEDTQCAKAMIMQKFNDRLLNVLIRKQNMWRATFPNPSANQQ
jgi:hypothetical protein